MSKPASGHFNSTNAATINDWSSYTTNVWSSIKATQENYPHTQLPRSFVMSTDSGQLWVHPHATGHMYDDITTNKNNQNRLKISNPNLYTQFILHDFKTTINIALKQNLKYNKSYDIGNWQFTISPPRQKEQYPVVKHAVFKGWK